MKTAAELAAEYVAWNRQVSDMLEGLSGSAETLGDYAKYDEKKFDAAELAWEKLGALAAAVLRENNEKGGQ